MKWPSFALVPSRWLAGLAPRERWVLLGGTILLVVLMVVFLVVMPGLEWLENQSRVVKEKSATLEWMKQSALEVGSLKKLAGSVTPVTTTGESLLALADRTAKVRGLGGALQRVEPEGEGRVRLWFEKVAFEKLMEWMAELLERHAARADTITIDREEEPGLVRARVVLSWPERAGANRGAEK
ncbi:MAG: type II secretion system protein M [Magnetococcus sp. YQC-5]